MDEPKKTTFHDSHIDPKAAMHEDTAAAAETIFSTPREPYCQPGFRGLGASYYVALCALFSALGGLLFGYDQGVVSVILVEEQFLDRFTRIAEGSGDAGFWKGLLTAMIELGALIGALNQGWIADKYSRKYSIVMAVIVFIIGSALQTAAMDYSMLVVARFIGGLGIGMLSMVAPLYISEISPPEIRGSLLVLEELSIVTGIVIAFWITYGTYYMDGEWAWRLPFLLQILPGLVLGVGILFLPFSPRWLASKGRDEEALVNLAKLRQLPTTDPRVQMEWFDIRAEVALHQEISAERHPHLQEKTRVNRLKLEIASWMDCFRKGCWRRTHVGAGLMFFQQFVGINALIYYSPTLFETMGLDYNMRLIMSGVLNITQLVGVSSSLWTMDRFGRRPLLLAGSAFMFIAHLIIACLVGKFSDNWPAHRPEGWASVAMLLFYMLAFGASWGPVPWAVPSEVFPSSLRAKGVALSTCSNWFNNFIIGLITPPLIQHTGFGAYVFFAVFCLLSLVWTFFFVPETNGKSLEDMDHVFKDIDSTAEEHRRERIEREIVARSTTVFAAPENKA
ncbi:High-affinity glucose transporter [Fulvia fulva]|nr:High-affinity glucose transporter [Fulvia fulva]